MDPSTKYSNPTRPGQGIRTESSTSKDLAHDTSNNELSFCEVAVEDDDAPPLSTNGSKSKDFSQGVMRRLSRHGTRKAKPEVPPKPRRSRPSLSLCQILNRRCPRAAQEEIDNIELYAAPATAGIKNPPMLSSYAPRPALRPRANTDGAATMLKPTKSITVGQARLAYAKSVSRNKRTSGAAPNGTSTSATRPDTTTPPAYRRTANASSDTINQEDVLSMNNPRQSTASRRKSRQVPEGWGTSSDILETSKVISLHRISNFNCLHFAVHM